MKPLAANTTEEIYQYCLEQRRKKLYPNHFPTLLTINITALLLFYGEQYKDILFDILDDTIITDQYDFEKDPSHLLNEPNSNQSSVETHGFLIHRINFKTTPFTIEHNIFLNQNNYHDFHTTIETAQHELTHLFHIALGKFEKQKRTIIYKRGFIEDSYTGKHHTLHSTQTKLIEELFTTESAAQQLQNWKLIKESLKNIPKIEETIKNRNFPSNYQSQFYSDLIEVTKRLRHNRKLWNEMDRYPLDQPGIQAITTKINSLLDREDGFETFHQNLRNYTSLKRQLEQIPLTPGKTIDQTIEQILTVNNSSEQSYKKIKKQIHTMNNNHRKQRRYHE